ncbi:MAG: 50S ribosomal protein L20 [Candidatus Omnitrophica bacterium]|nr:50S ribosomal protein L20 [Candidatus Omnitrophota bacterium]
MVRIKTNVATQKRKKKVLKQAKGQFGHRSKRYRQAVRSVVKGLTYQYRDRKVKKREFRRLWIVRISAACQEAGILYSRFINGLTVANVDIDRKVLAEMAVNSPEAFKKLVNVAQDALKSGIKKADASAN